MTEPSSAPALRASVRAVIDRLELQPHPEGGWYRETHRSCIRIASSALPRGYRGPRSVVTSILFLLPTGACSRPHRVRSEELWIHQQGDDLELTVGAGLLADGTVDGPAVTLGQGAEAALQCAVPGDAWQAAVAQPGPLGYALVGCVVAPGFDFDDFELAPPA